MDFVILFGPPAVGKMTVAYALTELTGLPTFHNHMTIDLVLPLFAHGTPAFRRLVAADLRGGRGGRRPGADFYLRLGSGRSPRQGLRR